MKRRLSEYVSLGFVYTSTGFTIGILFLILFYIIWNGIFYNNQKEYEVTFKIGYVNGEIISERPEYDDLEKIAKDTGLALRKVKEMIR